MKENKIVYGLIGFGGMGKWHTEILENVPEIELAGIYDIKEEKRKLAEEAGFHTYETEEAMLADESIDVILVATPNDTQTDRTARHGGGEKCHCRETRYSLSEGTYRTGGHGRKDRPVPDGTPEQTMG